MDPVLVEYLGKRYVLPGDAHYDDWVFKTTPTDGEVVRCINGFLPTYSFVPDGRVLFRGPPNESIVTNPREAPSVVEWTEEEKQWYKKRTHATFGGIGSELIKLEFKNGCANGNLRRFD